MLWLQRSDWHRGFKEAQSKVHLRLDYLSLEGSCLNLTDNYYITKVIRQSFVRHNNKVDDHHVNSSISHYASYLYFVIPPILWHRITGCSSSHNGGQMEGLEEVNAMSLYPKVLSSFLWVLVHALNLQSPATAPLGLLPKKYVSSFLSPRWGSPETCQWDNAEGSER